MVYIIQGKHGIDCFTNLLKLIREYSVLTYHPIYDGLNKDGEIERNDYKINKVKLK